MWIQMQVWNVLHVARWKYRQKLRKKSPSAHHHTNLSSYTFVTKACIDNRKSLLHSNISSKSLHNIVNFDPLMAENISGVWATPANFNGVRILSSLLHQCHSTEVSQTLYDVWPSPGLLHYTCTFRGLLLPNGILPCANFILHPSVVASYIGSVTVSHSNSGRQPNFVPRYKEWNYGIFTYFLAGRPSRWVTANILVITVFDITST